MLQIVEQGLAVGDVLPEFALPDGAGRIVASDDLLGARAAGAGLLPRPLVPLLQHDARGAGPDPARRSRRLGGAMVAVAPLPQRGARPAGRGSAGSTSRC